MRYSKTSSTGLSAVARSFRGVSILSRLFVFHNADCFPPKVFVVVFLELTQHRQRACRGPVQAAWAFDTTVHSVSVFVGWWKQCVFRNHCDHTDTNKAFWRGFVGSINRGEDSKNRNATFPGWKLSHISICICYKLPCFFN